MSLAIGVESSDNLGVPLYTNATDYVMHDADIEQRDYSE